MSDGKPPGLPMSDEAICKLFSYYPSFIQGNTDNNANSFVDNLLEEINHASEGQPASNVTSFYLTVDQSILNFPTKSLTEYIHITKLLSIVNSLNLGAKMNSSVL